MLSTLANIVIAVRRAFLVLGLSALCGALIAGLSLPMVGALGLGARAGADWFREMDVDFEPAQLPETSRILDAEGRTLASFFAENRDYAELDQVADVMIDAILAVEDDRFFDRGPIDFRGTMRALLRNVEAGETRGGGSTLTQQYVKMVRASQAGTPEERAEAVASEGVDGYKRKLEELRMAIIAEQEFSKEELLERYLNIAYFGARAYGVQTAARTYFSTDAKDLTLNQAALLAGLLQSPSLYDPNRNPDAARARRNIVLSRMADTGKITELEAARARQAELELHPSKTPNGCVSSNAGFFCDYVVNEIRNLEELGGSPEEREDALYKGGLVIETTLEREIQQAADRAVSARVAATDEAIASLASVEPGTGHIKALANSRKYGVEGAGVSNVNFAVDKDMGGSVGIQPGSAAKTFVLAAALERGISVGTTFDAPAQISLPINSFRDCHGSIRSTEIWQPRNYDGDHGNINLRTATERSVNTYYAQLARRTGLCAPANLAEKLGAGRADGNDYHVFPSLVLGSNEVSPLGMAEAYATFANDGVHCPATAITRVQDRAGHVIVDHSSAACRTVLKKSVARSVNRILEGVIHNPGGTGGRMRLKNDRRAAGKTGTTNSAVAVWFVGHVPELSTAVAVADVDGHRNTGRLRSLHGMSFNGELIGNACGGCIPGPIWKQFMDDVLEY